LNKVVFNKTITLVKCRTGYGSSGAIDTVRKNVRASVDMPGISFAVRAEAAGRKIDLFAVVYRSDFLSESFTHAEYDGKRYRIDGANRAQKDRLVRLSLVRG